MLADVDVHGELRNSNLADLPGVQQLQAKDQKTLILLCTYNEAGNLPKMFAQLDEHAPDCDVLVVDDQSPDGTARLVAERAQADERFHLLERSGKLGLGTATRDGMHWCLERNYDFLVNLDADLSHDPASIPALRAACVDDISVDVAVGSRYVAGGGLDGLTWHRRIISRVLNRYATQMLALPVRDCSGSFRCYRVSALRMIDLDTLTCPGYGFLEEILVALHRSGARMREVPIRFDTRYHGQSKLGWRDAVGALKVIHQMILRRR